MTVVHNRPVRTLRAIVNKAIRRQHVYAQRLRFFKAQHRHIYDQEAYEASKKFNIEHGFGQPQFIGKGKLKRKLSLKTNTKKKITLPKVELPE